MEIHTHPTAGSPTTSDPAAADPGPSGPARWSPPAALRALGWACVVTAVAVGAGYAASRWGASMPLKPLPGSLWPYLGAWGAFCFAAHLLLRWATAGTDFEGGGQLIALPVFAGIRLSLLHRPDLGLLYAYGAAALALAAVAAALWRRRRRRTS
ncbi:hypothetical protein ACFWSF_31275 [Streptomyces sp. NPDC058611]|uniref:hypothetical protein n=1 Tax=unclassified Streptomyces TaxID=2593676 RepID=UPI0036581045